MLVTDLQAIHIKARLVRLNLLLRLYTTFGHDQQLTHELDELDVFDSYIQRYLSVYGFMVDYTGNLTDLNLLQYMQRLQGLINRYQSNFYISLSTNYQMPCICKSYSLTTTGKYLVVSSNIPKVITSTVAPIFYAYTLATTTAYSSWTINHALNTYPAIVTTDLSGQVMYGTVVYNNQQTVTAGWGITAKTGYGYAIAGKVTIFNQGTPSTNWIIPHNLGRFPYVTLVDITGNRIPFMKLKYVDSNNISISFTNPFAGSAYLLAGAGQVYNFFTPSLTYAINHNLGRIPTVTVVDIYGNVTYEKVQYIDNNNVLVTNSTPTIGQTYLE